jgi:hypothetical protein
MLFGDPPNHQQPRLDNAQTAPSLSFVSLCQESKLALRFEAMPNEYHKHSVKDASIFYAQAKRLRTLAKHKSSPFFCCSQVL